MFSDPRRKKFDIIAPKLTDRQKAILDCANVEAVLAFVPDAVDRFSESVLDIAACCVRLKQLGHSPGDCGFKMKLGYAEQILSGQLLVALFVEFGSRPKILRRAALLPPAEQALFAENKPIRVLEPSGDVRMVPALDLTDRQIDQVLCDGRFCTDSEQAQWLSDQRKQEAVVDPDECPVRVVGTHLVISAPTKLSKSQVKAFLDQLNRKGRSNP